MGPGIAYTHRFLGLHAIRSNRTLVPPGQRFLLFSYIEIIYHIPLERLAVVELSSYYASARTSLLRAMVRKLMPRIVLLLICVLMHSKCMRDGHVSRSISASVALLDEALSNNACPLPKESIDLEFPVGFPQNLTLGRFRDQTGFPFITQDFWAEIVDNRRTFFLRPKDHGFPSTDHGSK